MRCSTGKPSLESSDAYFSLKASRKLRALSVGLEGRTNDAAVGLIPWPGRDI